MHGLALDGCEFGYVATNVHAVGVEALGLPDRVEPAVGPGVVAGAGHPLPVAGVVRHVAVEQPAEEPLRRPRRQSRPRCLVRKDAVISRARLCIQPSARSWRMPASTIGTPVGRPASAASASVVVRQLVGRRPCGRPRWRSSGTRTSPGSRSRASRAGGRTASGPGRPRARAFATASGDRQPKRRYGLSREVPSAGQVVVPVVVRPDVRRARLAAGAAPRSRRPAAASGDSPAGAAGSRPTATPVGQRDRARRRPPRHATSPPPRPGGTARRPGSGRPPPGRTSPGLHHRDAGEEPQRHAGAARTPARAALPARRA